MAEAVPNPYTIDAVAVNSRVDWRHQYLPGPPESRQENTFPGIGERFAVVGPTLPPDLIVSGFIEGAGATRHAAIQALNANLATENARRGTLHTVACHGFSLVHCDLVEFRTVGNLFPIAQGDGSFKVAIGVRYAWRQLRV
jgi:hypothetical protein